MKMITKLGFATVLAVAAAACSSSKSSNDAPASNGAFAATSCAAQTPNATITTVDGTLAFSPATTSLTMGQVVEFKMSSTHNVAGTGTAAGLNVDFGGDSCYRFVATGSFTFKCTAHGFTGTITVQ